MDKRINCYHCRHYYVTWDKKHPHGCRALGFKTRNLPSFAVFRESGTLCLYFRAKNKGRQPPG